MYRYLFIVLCIWVFVTATVQAESRLALVIGNGDYQHEPTLNNPVNDAEDMAEVLKNLGFEILLKPNLGKREMVTVVREFGDKLPKYDVGLFYYSGHGLQADGVNYLLPVDAEIKSTVDIEFESVDANRISAYMEQANNGVNIVILDACRDNPYQTNLKGVRKGLAEMKGPTGSLIAFATAPNKPSWGGEEGERNSIYTKHLLKMLRTQAQLSVLDLLTEVAGSVKAETKGEQVPWKSDSLTEKFCLALTGCGSRMESSMSTPPQKAQGGVVLGGILGDAHGQSTQLLLPEIFSPHVRQQVAQILEKTSTGQMVAWKESDTGIGYEVTIIKTYNTPTGACRDYQTVVIQEKQRESVYSKACRQIDGTWKLLEQTLIPR